MFEKYSFDNIFGIGIERSTPRSSVSESKNEK